MGWIHFPLLFRFPAEHDIFQFLGKRENTGGGREGQGNEKQFMSSRKFGVDLNNRILALECPQLASGQILPVVEVLLAIP